MWEILVPNSMPSHTPFTESAECPHTGDPINKITMYHHKKWDDKVRSIAGGLTVMRTAKGEWVNDTNHLYRERMIPVRIVCTLNEIKELAVWTKTHYEQEAILFYKISDEVYFV